MEPNLRPAQEGIENRLSILPEFQSSTELDHKQLLALGLDCIDTFHWVSRVPPYQRLHQQQKLHILNQKLCYR